MTIKELITQLQEYPEETPIRLTVDDGAWVEDTPDFVMRRLDGPRPGLLDPHPWRYALHLDISLPPGLDICS